MSLNVAVYPQKMNVVRDVQWESTPEMIDKSHDMVFQRQRNNQNSGFLKANDQTDAYFEDFPKFYFLDSLKKLERRFEKCIELKGDHVEK